MECNSVAINHQDIVIHGNTVFIVGVDVATIDSGAVCFHEDTSASVAKIKAIMLEMNRDCAIEDKATAIKAICRNVLLEKIKLSL